MQKPVSILWFRHGQRIHDNPALLEAIKNKDVYFLPIFIFDGQSCGLQNIQYNRIEFLINSLEDLDSKFQKNGGRLYIFNGKPVNIFQKLAEHLNIRSICFEQDCEPIWQKRDNLVKNLCSQLGIECIEKISHTLWDPREIIMTNGGIAPLTYQMFLHTIKIIGPPPRPVQNPNFQGVKFFLLPENIEKEFHLFNKIPKPDELDISFEYENCHIMEHKWIGGETEALNNLNIRLKVEENAFQNGFYLPNQAIVDILGESKSVSAHLRFGNLSVRRFYWEIHDLFGTVQHSIPVFNRAPKGSHITGQLIWREYFYTMSVNNPYYDQIENNDICLNIPWRIPIGNELERWKTGQTGFPLVDAAMRQLLSEGWLHHTLRNLLASFLTRGGLWLSWEWGVKHFLKYLLDADWSVCAGNWMWVSSSAFEKLLDSSKCTCPNALARRLDPNGEYILRYVPELKTLPKQFIHEPWKTPENIQTTYGCILGIDYPHRMIDLQEASEKNYLAMESLRKSFTYFPDHCRPSSEDEIRQFFWIS